jgi:hypothetical protein
VCHWFVSCKLLILNFSYHIIIIVMTAGCTLCSTLATTYMKNIGGGGQGVGPGPPVSGNLERAESAPLLLLSSDLNQLCL